MHWEAGRPIANPRSAQWPVNTKPAKTQGRLLSQATAPSRWKSALVKPRQPSSRHTRDREVKGYLKSKVIWGQKLFEVKGYLLRQISRARPDCPLSQDRGYSASEDDCYSRSKVTLGQRTAIIQGYRTAITQGQRLLKVTGQPLPKVKGYPRLKVT